MSLQSCPIPPRCCLPNRAAYPCWWPVQVAQDQLPQSEQSEALRSRKPKSQTSRPAPAPTGGSCVVTVLVVVVASAASSLWMEKEEGQGRSAAATVRGPPRKKARSMPGVMTGTFASLAASSICWELWF